MQKYIEFESDLIINQEEKLKLKNNKQKKTIDELKEKQKKIENLEMQQVNDKEKMYDLIMTVLDNPEKTKEILSKKEE